MKRFCLCLVGFAALGLCVSAAYAGPECAGKKAEGATAGSGGCGKPCHGGAGGSASENEKVKSVMASLPAMKYRVGDQTVCCPNGAGIMAKTENKPIQYVVGEEVFSSEAEATVKLVALLEKEIESLSSLRFSVNGESTGCPQTAKSMAEKSKATVAYKVGGVDFADQAKAEAAVKLVADAAAAVKSTYKVDGKSFCCDKMAGAAAKDSGKPIVYVVGDSEIETDSAAKLAIAQAKIRAIVEAASAAQSS